MILDQITNCDSIAAAILERDVTKRVGKDAYPLSNFRYSSYNVDPKPKVLLLGRFESSIGNKLLAGVNINYLSEGQLGQLRKHLKNLFLRKSLKSRYWYLKRRLPDIAQYYRTYDEDEIHAMGADQLTTYDPKKRKVEKEREPEPDDEKAKSKADVEKLVQIATEPPDVTVDKPEDPDVADDSGREAWQMQQRLYDPDTGNRQEPERDKIRGAIANKRAKRERYRQQRRELKQLERQAEMDRIAAQLDREKELDALQDLYDQPEYDLSRMRRTKPRQSEIDDMYEHKDFRYHPEVGFVWSSPESYITWHEMPRFREIMEMCDKVRLLAVHDLISGKTVLDAVIDHSNILVETDWDYDHTVLFEVRENDLVSKFESQEGHAVIDEFLNSDAVKLLVESG